MSFDKPEGEIGAVWSKTSAKGVEYMTGKIEGVGDVVMFKAKPTEKGPAWRVLKSTPKDGRKYDDGGF